MSYFQYCISAQAVDRFQYQLFMYEYTGGVAAVTRDQYHALNGFSNLYLGWGCEDEDFYIRIVDRGFTLVRVHEQLSRYRTLPHVPNYPNWFWDQAISKLDRERFPNLQQIVDKDGSCQRFFCDSYTIFGEGPSIIYFADKDHCVTEYCETVGNFADSSIKDGANTDRFDYNKFLQEGAGFR